MFYIAGCVGLLGCVVCIVLLIICHISGKSPVIPLVLFLLCFLIFMGGGFLYSKGDISIKKEEKEPTTQENDNNPDDSSDTATSPDPAAEDNAADDNTDSSSQEQSTAPNSAGLSIGDTARLGDWIINVTGFEFLSTIQTSNYTSFNPEEGCQYAVVSLTVTNDGKEADRFLPSLSVLDDVVASVYYKDEYEYSASTLLGYDSDLHDVSLNPLTSKSGCIVFEVPDLVANGTESLSISFTSGIQNDVTFSLRG